MLAGLFFVLILNCWWKNINSQIDSIVFKNATEFSDVDFFKIGFSIEELNFSFSLQYWFTISIFCDPFPFLVEDTDA